MAIQLNHTIVPARDPRASALFLAEILGRDAPGRFGPFWTVALGNGVTLDFLQCRRRRPDRASMSRTCRGEATLRHELSDEFSGGGVPTAESRREEGDEPHSWTHRRER